MSKEYGNIDELFKAELGGSAPKAPAHVKKNIDKALGFGSGKKILWILFPVLIVLIATPFIYNAFQSEDLAQSSNIDNTIAQNPPNNNSEVNQSNTNSQSSTITLSSNEISTDSAISNQSSSTNFGNTNTSKKYNETGNSPVNYSSNTSNPKVIGNGTSNTKSNPKINKNESNTPSVGLTNKTTHPKNLNIGGGIKTATPPTIKNDSDSTAEKLPNLTINTTTDTSGNTPTLITPNDLVTNPLNGGNNKAIDPKSTIPPSVKKDTSELVLENDLSNNPPADSLTQIENTDTNAIAENPGTDTTAAPAPIDDFKDSYKPWMLSLTTGINFKNSNITTSNLSDTAAYANSINDKIGHSASFEAQYRLKNSLTFGAGIGYSTHIENFNYFKSEITSDSALYYVYFQDSIPDSSGWIYFQDSTAQYNYTSDTNEIYNANGRNINTFLHIPVSIGTQLRFNKFLVDLYAMGRFNLLLISKTTYVQNDQLVTTSLANIKRSYFDLVIGTNVHYNLVGNLYLTGTLRYRAPFNSPYYVNGMSNRFSNLHLGIGVSLNL